MSSIPVAPLESILCTEELHRRQSRPPDYATENRALVKLVSALADSPSSTLQTLAETILDVTQCDSAGLSLLTRDGRTPNVCCVHDFTRSRSWACSLGWNVATHYRPFHCSKVSGVRERAPRTEFIERVELRPQLRRPFAPTPALHNTAWLSASDSASRDSARRARASKARSMAWPIRERQTAPTPTSRRAWASSLCKVPYRVVLVAAIIADANP